MKNTIIKQALFLVVGLLFAVATMPGTAEAACTVGCTASNTDITNTANILWTVGGSDPTAGAGLDSNTTTFKVDNLVDQSVTWTDGANVGVSLNAATVEMLTFRIDNTGNTTQKYQFLLTVDAGDDFDMQNLVYYVDDVGGAGVAGTYDAGLDDAVTDNFTVSAAVIAGGTTYVYVRADTLTLGLPIVDGDLSNYTITARPVDAAAADGAGMVTETAGGAETLAAVDVLWGDTDTTGTNVAGDGLHLDIGTYVVESAIITIVKTSTVIRDPFNLNVNPLAVPGAYIQYDMAITNAGAATASAVLTTIADTINADTTISPIFIVPATGAAENGVNDVKVVITGTARPGGSTFWSDEDGDGANLSVDLSTVISADGGGIGWLAGELKPGETATVSFHVTID